MWCQVDCGPNMAAARTNGFEIFVLTVAPTDRKKKSPANIPIIIPSKRTTTFFMFLVIMNTRCRWPLTAVCQHVSKVFQIYSIDSGADLSAYHASVLTS